MRWTAFWTAMAATPAKPVTSAAGASLSANGPSVTASTKNATSNTTFAISRSRTAGHCRAIRAAPANRTRATTRMNSGSASSLAMAPCVPSTRVAPSVTKFPVTCAVKRPCRPRKPAVSTKPATKLSRAAMRWFFIASSCPRDRIFCEGPGTPRGAGMRFFRAAVAQKVHQSEAGALKWPAKKVDTATGAQVKKLFVASVAVVAVALSAPVLAADMPPYPVAKGPIVGGFDWEGFYVGGHIGGAWENTTFNQTNVSWTGLPGGGSTSVNTGESGSLGGTSITGGLQIGYNWLIPGPFLFGLEADISGAGLSSTALTSPPGDPLAVAQWNEKVDVYGSLRARLGWVSGDCLFYGTGGFGWDYGKLTRSQLTAPFNVALPFVDTNALQGGTVV